MSETNDFPRLNINTRELMDAVEGLIDEARGIAHEEEFGAVNWGDIGVADVEYRLSMVGPREPFCVVTVEEADGASHLQQWLNERLDKERFPRTHVVCEW